MNPFRQHTNKYDNIRCISLVWAEDTLSLPVLSAFEFAESSSLYFPLFPFFPFQSTLLYPRFFFIFSLYIHVYSYISISLIISLLMFFISLSQISVSQLFWLSFKFSFSVFFCFFSLSAQTFCLLYNYNILKVLLKPHKIVWSVKEKLKKFPHNFHYFGHTVQLCKIRISTHP